MTKQFAPYESYKDSGVEWLGSVPNSWILKKAKYVFIDHVEKNHPNAELLSVTQDHGVIPRAMVENRMVMPSGNLHTFKHIEKGDFAISLRSFEGGFEFCHYDGIISPAYTVLKNVMQINEPYFKYLFKSHSFILGLQTCTVGIREGKNISYEEFAINCLPMPDIQEQQKIADFLDKKTAQIDEAIAQKEKMIELLKEYRQITINNAVTKGLDPDVLMKDSGIEWLGQILAHWEIKKLKFILTEKLKYGANESGIDYSEKLPRYIRITDFGNNGKLSDVNKLSLPTHIANDYLLKDGDILFARSGGTVGKSYQFRNNISYDESYCFAGYLIKASANEQIILSDFLYLYTNSPLFYLWKDFIFNKATIENIGADKYAQLPVIIPPIEEQTKILEVFKELNDKIEASIICKQQEIEKLKEYKATLIDSAVTGKIKV